MYFKKTKSYPYLRKPCEQAEEEEEDDLPLDNMNICVVLYLGALFALKRGVRKCMKN